MLVAWTGGFIIMYLANIYYTRINPPLSLLGYCSRGGIVRCYRYSPSKHEYCPEQQGKSIDKFNVKQQNWWLLEIELVIMNFDFIFWMNILYLHSQNSSKVHHGLIHWYKLWYYVESTKVLLTQWNWLMVDKGEY